MCHQSQIKFHSEVGDFFCPSINDRHDFWLPVNTVDADLWLCQQSSSLSPSIWLLLGIFNLPIRVITIIIIITILKIKGLYYTHFFSPWVLIVEWCPGEAYKMSKCCYKIFVEHFSALSPRSSSHFLRAISNGLCTIWFVIQTLRSAKKCEEKYIVRCDICPEDTIIGDATD